MKVKCGVCGTEREAGRDCAGCTEPPSAIWAAIKIGDAFALASLIGARPPAKPDEDEGFSE